MTLGCEIRNVVALFPRRVFLQWDLTDPTETGSYTFTVERSGSSNGPWEALATGAQNTYNYIDDLTQADGDSPDTPHLFSLQRQIYYRVTAIPPSGCANQAVSIVHGIEPEIPPVQRGLRRKLRYEEYRLWKAYSGVQVALLKRRSWGDRCTTCYDALTRTVLHEHCSVCYGTSFVGGYWDPVITFARIHPPHNITAQTTQRDTNESSQHLLTLLDVPSLEDGDLIVEIETNQRHIVRRQTQTELKRRSVHQQVTTSLLQRGAVEYEIPVDFRTSPQIF